MNKASLRSHLALWFAGLSLHTLVSSGFHGGLIATAEMKQASSQKT